MYKCGIHRIIENRHLVSHPIFPSLPIAEIWSDQGEDEVSYNPICSEYLGRSVISDGLEYRFPLGILKPEMLVTHYGISPIRGYSSTVLVQSQTGTTTSMNTVNTTMLAFSEFTQGPAGLPLQQGWHGYSECRWIEPVAEIMTALDQQLQSVDADECLRYMLECFQHLNLISYLGDI